MQDLVGFPPFESWVVDRTWKVAYRVGISGTIIFVVLVLADFAFFAWTQASLATVSWRALTLVALCGMSWSLRQTKLGTKRIDISIVFGFMAQIAMVYVNMMAPGREFFVPFIVLFFLLGLLIMAPAVPLRTFLISSIFTLTYLSILLVSFGASQDDWVHVLFMVLPALAFLGHAVISQRNNARELWNSTRIIHVKSTVDYLSSLLNRQAWYERCQTSLGDKRQEPSPSRQLAFIMLDIDHFKRINDTWGHECGDMVIKEVSASIVEATRDGDLAGRLGGEEFGILLPDADAQTARQVAERIRKSIENLHLDYRGQSIRLTASLGLCLSSNAPLQLDDLVRQGDTCLYKAKNSGRNRVEEGSC